MTLDRADFSRIRLGLAAALLALVLGGTLAWLADRWHDASIRAQSLARAELNEFEGKLRQVNSEEAEIKQKSALFSNLNARGIIGPEQRLDWVELIKDVRDARKLLDVQYEFSPQQALEKGGSGAYAFKSSSMRLQMKLLHEYDLLNFVNDLRSRAKAHVRVRSCNVSRIPRGPGSTEAATLTAECELEWITIQTTKEGT